MKLKISLKNPGIVLLSYRWIHKTIQLNMPKTITIQLLLQYIIIQLLLQYIIIQLQYYV